MTGRLDTNYKGSGTYIRRAFKKYGINNFVRIDLGEFQNKDEAHYWEGFYIKLYKTEVKYNGYNISPKGGLGAYNDCLSEDTKQRISQKLKGRHSGIKPMLGKHHSIETKIKIKESNIGKSKNKGCKHTEEHIEKQRSSMIGKNLNNKSKTGKKDSSETLLKKSDSGKTAWIKRKQKLTKCKNEQSYFEI
jgi:hypothetical protein